jgi:hypothetical protein
MKPAESLTSKKTKVPAGTSIGSQAKLVEGVVAKGLIFVEVVPSKTLYGGRRG